MRSRRVLAEFVGILILSLGICLTDGSPYAGGSALWAAIIGTGFVSGAQFNPSITVAIILTGLYKRRLTKEDFVEHGVYILIHFAGAAIGALLSWGIRSETFELTVHANTFSAYLAEVSATTSLALVAMVGGELKNSFFIGTLAVAITLYAGLFITGPISGGCLNPAIGIGANWMDAMNHGSLRAQHIYIYLLGPFTGSLVAATFYLIIHPEIEFFYKNLKEPEESAQKFELLR